MSKQQLRKWAKEERKNFDLETLSIKLVEKLKETIEYKNAKNISDIAVLSYESVYNYFFIKSIFKY